MTDSLEPKDFRIRNRLGKLYKYKKGDIVRKSGKEYIATKNTQGYSPEHGLRGGWKEINKTRITNFTSSSTPPEIAVEGDEWVDDDGIFFKYLKNELDGVSQWVEV